MNDRTPPRYSILAVLVVLVATGHSAATVLTFDIFTDPAKTTRIANNSILNVMYGDNVSDFDPAEPVGAHYVRYGSGGGITPNVSVAYWFYVRATGGIDGEGSSTTWGSTTQYGGMDNVVYARNGTTYYSQIEFIPEPGYSVRINSLDYGGWLTDQPGLTLKIVANANGPDARLLWQAGPDGGVTFPGTYASVTPMTLGRPGEKISLIWGGSNLAAIDNLSFSQFLPEPATAALLALGLGACCTRRARSAQRG